MRANLASGMDGGTVYPFSRVGSNPLWADAGPFFGPITESNAPFHLPVCPQRDTLTTTPNSPVLPIGGDGLTLESCSQCETPSLKWNVAKRQSLLTCRAGGAIWFVFRTRLTLPTSSVTWSAGGCLRTRVLSYFFASFLNRCLPGSTTTNACRNSPSECSPKTLVSS